MLIVSEGRMQDAHGCIKPLVFRKVIQLTMNIVKLPSVKDMKKELVYLMYTTQREEGRSLTLGEACEKMAERTNLTEEFERGVFRKGGKDYFKARIKQTFRSIEKNGDAELISGEFFLTLKGWKRYGFIQPL